PRSRSRRRMMRLAQSSVMEKDGRCDHIAKLLRKILMHVAHPGGSNKDAQRMGHGVYCFGRNVPIIAKMNKRPPTRIVARFQAPKRELGSWPGDATALMWFT